MKRDLTLIEIKQGDTKFSIFSQVDFFSSMAAKPINIHWIITGSFLLKNHLLHRITYNF